MYAQEFAGGRGHVALKNATSHVSSVEKRSKEFIERIVIAYSTSIDRDLSELLCIPRYPLHASRL